MDADQARYIGWVPRPEPGEQIEGIFMLSRKIRPGTLCRSHSFSSPIKPQQRLHPANNLTSRGAMQSHEELLTVIRNLKESRRAKHKEQQKEESRLEELKVRLRIKLDRNAETPNDTPIPKTA
jgi:hypothetical protein